MGMLQTKDNKTGTTFIFPSASVYKDIQNSLPVSRKKNPEKKLKICKKN